MYEPGDEKVYAERPNKTQLKKVMREYNDMGKTLIGIPAQKLDEVPMSDRLRDAIVTGRRLSKGALQRHLRFIAGIMGEEDFESIQAAVDKLNKPHQEDVALLHEVENWRDCLIAGDMEVMNELFQTFYDIDRQHILQLVRNANKEAKANKPPKSSRALFKYLRELREGLES